MSSVDCLPYLTYFSERQKPIIGIIIILHLFYLNGGKLSLPSPFAIVKRAYDHKGISSDLETCIDYYNNVLDFEEKLDAYMTYLDTDFEPRWKVLEVEYLQLESHFKDVKAELETIASIKSANNGILPAIYNEYIESEEGQVKRLFAWATIMSAQRDALYIELSHPPNLDFNFDQLKELQKKLNDSFHNELLPALIHSMKIGLNLVNHPELNLPSYPDAFNISHVKELHEIFTDLDCTVDSMDNEIKLVGLTLIDPNRFLGDLTPTEKNKEMMILKYVNIPNSIRANKESLRQFSTWVQREDDKTKKQYGEFNKKVNTSYNGLLGFITRIDNGLSKEITQLCQELMS